MTQHVSVLTLAKGTQLKFQYNGKPRVGTVDKDSFKASTGNHILIVNTEEGPKSFNQAKMFEVEVL